MQLAAQPPDRQGDDRLRFSAIFDRLHSFNTLPSMIIVGAQKAGTSSLFDYVKQNPNFSASKRKEVHYFDTNFDRSLNWYKKHFHRTGRRLTFEASPYYIFHPAVPGRIKKTLPDAKFVVLLRDPVSRTISHYHHEASRGREPLSLEDALDAEAERLEGHAERLAVSPTAKSAAFRNYSYIARSLYAEQIERWYDYFPRSQFLFLTSEKMFKNPQWAVDTVADFMNVPSHPLKRTGIRNKNSYPDTPSALKADIRRRLGDRNARLPELIGFTPEWLG